MKRTVCCQEKMSKQGKHTYISLLFIIFFMMCVLVNPADLFAQSTKSGGIPPERWEKNKPTRKPPLPSVVLGISSDSAKAFHLPPLDRKVIIAEERRWRREGEAPSEGLNRSVNITPNTHGEWFDIDNGKGSIWRRCPFLSLK